MNYGFYEETYDHLPSIVTLGTGDGKSAFTVLTYPEDKKTAIGFGYGEGRGVGAVMENIEGIRHDEIGIKFQVKFESVGSIDAMINILKLIRVSQSEYLGLPPVPDVHKPTIEIIGPVAVHDQSCAVLHHLGESAVLDTTRGIFKPSWAAQKEGFHLVFARNGFQRWLLKTFFNVK